MNVSFSNTYTREHVIYQEELIYKIHVIVFVRPQTQKMYKIFNLCYVFEKNNMFLIIFHYLHSRSNSCFHSRDCGSVFFMIIVEGLDGGGLVFTIH